MNKKILSFVCALIITVASGFSLGVSASENSMQLQNKFLNTFYTILILIKLYIILSM